MSAEPTSSNRRDILLFDSAIVGDDRLMAALAVHGQVRTVSSVDEALIALRASQFDIVICQPTELFPLARSEARQRGELILDKIGQGVCIVNRSGALVWANPKLNSYPREIVEMIRQHCAELCGQLADERLSNDTIPSRRRVVQIDPEHVFDLTVSPLLTPRKQLQEAVGLVLDISASQRQQERINAIDAAGRELMRLDAEASAQLEVGERLALLEEKIIHFAHDLLDFDHFAVLVLDKQTNRLESIISTGLPEEAATLDIYAKEEGNGISGYVAATGRSYICADVGKDPRYLPGLERAGSSLTVPLQLHDQIVGVLDIETYEIAAFTEDDRQFAEIFGRYIAVALHMLKLLAVERSATTGQITSDMTSELARPLNDIIADTTSMIEDYVGQEDLRRRLHAVIDDVDRVKRSLHTLTETQGIRGLVSESTMKDPLLDGKRILVADDEDIIRETIADVLSKSGALTVMARDGQEAVAMIRSQHFDMVISDIKMPYKNGYEVFSVVREINIHCPVLLITGFGYDPDHSIVRAGKEGLAGVLFKPFKVEQLVDEVRRALTTSAT